MDDCALANTCKVSMQNILLSCLITPLYVFALMAIREKTMNEKTVGGEAHSVIRRHTDEHFTKQMLDI